MFQTRAAAGLDRSDVQLAFSSSPTWYVALAPVIFGGSLGKTVVHSNIKHPTSVWKTWINGIDQTRPITRRPGQAGSVEPVFSHDGLTKIPSNFEKNIQCFCLTGLLTEATD